MNPFYSTTARSIPMAQFVRVHGETCDYLHIVTRTATDKRRATTRFVKRLPKVY